MSTDELFTEKIRFIAAREKELGHALSKLEKELYETIFERVITHLHIQGGSITLNSDNLKVVDLIGVVAQQFNASKHIKVIEQFASDLIGVVDHNGVYFKELSPNAKKFANIRKDAKKLALDRMGVGKGNKLKPGGYLDNLLKETPISNRVGAMVRNSMEGGGNLTQLTKDLKSLIKGTKGKAGLFERYYQQYAYDTYQTMDAIVGDDYATKLGLKAGRYGGGLIVTSRHFCVVLNQKVVTTWEMKRIGRKSWGGKKSNNIRIDRGGHRCRHQWQYVSNDRAAKLRPDLEVDKAGKLGYKSGVTRQKIVI